MGIKIQINCEIQDNDREHKLILMIEYSLTNRK